VNKPKIIIINGPNLNLLGKRQTNIYGSQSFEIYFESLIDKYPDLDLEYFQSNHEGTILDKLHDTGFFYTGIVLNAGAYTHTSIALADAVAAITTPVIEVHISNVYEREEFRHHSYLEPVCKETIVGKGLPGYEMAIDRIMEISKASLSS